MDPIGINEDPVQMRSKTVEDFDKIDKLKDPEAKPPLSLTKYEMYLDNKEARGRTRGAF